MTELVALAEKLGGLPLAALLTLVLIGGYRKWWVFGWNLMDCEKRTEALLQAASKREDEWKDIARDGGRVARKAVDELVKRGG